MTDKGADEDAIRALFDIQGQAWTKGDPELFASAFAPDATFINIRAVTLRGREEIAAHHKQLWATVYKGADVRLGEVRIHFIRPDVATIEVESTLHVGEIERHAHMLAVAVNNAGHWELQAVHNMVPFSPPNS
jgi:uncharacterized protein (TIGR02246 family)